MAWIKRRQGKRGARYVVIYRDAGKTRWETYATRRQAEVVRAQKSIDARQARHPAVDPDITIEGYTKRWLDAIAASVKPRTVVAYEKALRCHVLPELGLTKVRRLSKGQIKALLTKKMASGLSRGSVNVILAVLRTMLQAAVDDEVILANPASRLGRQLHLAQPTKARQEEIKALTREQLALFLATAAKAARAHYALWLTLARAGLRLGEGLGLQWEDLDFLAREVRVARTLGEGRRVETPKSGHARRVDISRELGQVLQRLLVERKAETLRRGWRQVPAWVFVNTEGGPLNRLVVQRTFKRVLKEARLPLHLSPHCLRHTFASLLLQAGASPVYVQRQLGHSSIKLTVDTYGRWLPVGDKALVDRLDEASGSKTVATADGASANPTAQLESREAVSLFGR